VVETLVVDVSLRKWLTWAASDSKLTLIIDCKTLVSIIVDSVAYLCLSWRALELVVRLRRTLEYKGGRVEVYHVCREAVLSAHIIANLARKLG
jgi:hypothetical protein